MFKRYFFILALILTLPVIGGCTTNPATGDRQFTAFMSPAQEVQIGAQEHDKIVAQYGLYDDPKLHQYVENVGATVVRKTERPDVQYKFFVLDSPIVNAFALPGGYIYVTRGLLALSNNEAEMASVLGHEAGHITGRHSAERYSRGMVTSLGAAVLSSAIGNDVASQALGVGSQLYLSSYSRAQENQADTLGIRYLTHSGYDPHAMSGFLSNLQAEKELQAKINGGKNNAEVSYFSTHPPTGDRVHKTTAEAHALHIHDGKKNAERYLKMLNGLTYGDSAKQGFVRGQTFYHPEIGFKFSVPDGYRIINQPSQVIAKSKQGDLIVFDFASNEGRHDPKTFLRDVWMAKAKAKVHGLENVTVNGMPAATGYVEGSMNGKSVRIRVLAIQFSKTQIARFQIGIPSRISQAQLDALKSSSYSFARLSKGEKVRLRPYRIKIVTAKRSDNVATLSRKMAQGDHKEQRFRVLNGLYNGEDVVAGRLYKIVVE